MSRTETHPVGIGYLLWIFGFTGAHRFYYGKKLTGLLWLCTGVATPIVGATVVVTAVVVTAVAIGTAIRRAAVSADVAVSTAVPRRARA